MTIEIRRRTPEEQCAYRQGFHAGVEMALGYAEKGEIEKAREIAGIIEKTAQGDEG